MKKVKNSDIRPVRHKTLDELEGVVWGPPTYGSHLVQTCHRLRTTPIGEFSVEDLRIMIGQNLGLPYLLPLALDHLEENPWAAGDMYPGDLLAMTVRADFPWSTNQELSVRLREIVERVLADIPNLVHDEPDGLPNLDLPGEALARKLAVDLRAVQQRLA